MGIPTRMWEAGGLTDANGHLDRPLAAGRYYVPDTISLDGKWVTWGSVIGAEVEPRPGMLDRFVRLGAGKPGDVLKFARRWGPLGLGFAFKNWVRSPREPMREIAQVLLGCELPDGIGGERRGRAFGQHPDTGETLYSKVYREPVSVYAALATHVKGILSDVAEIYSGKLTAKDWEARHPYHCETCSYGLDRACEEIERRVHVLTRIGQVSFGLRWDGEQWRIETSFPGLLGALAAQLLLVVSRSDSLYTCSGCGSPYIRSARIDSGEGRFASRTRRRPRPEQANYCVHCGNDRALLDAKRRWRAKVLEARRLHTRDGLSAAEIARQLNARRSSVENWISRKVKL